MSKKILAAIVLASLCVVSVAGATPMTEFKKGDLQIDVGGWQHGGKFDKIGATGENLSGDSKIGFVGTATYAIADKWGVQYSYHDLTTGNLDNGYDNYHVGGYQNELNVLYSFDPKAAAYVGWDYLHGNVASQTRKNNVVQVGIVAKTPLTNKLDLYGNFALGTKSTLLGEAGLGYNLAKNLDLNFGYRYLKTEYSSNEYSIKGFFMGVSGRFGK